MGYPSETRLKLKSRLPITYFAVTRSFFKFCTDHSDATAVLCAKFQNDWQLKRMLWTNEISRDLSLRWVSDGYPVLHSSLFTLCYAEWTYNLACRSYKPDKSPTMVTENVVVHYIDVIMTTVASQITSLVVVYSIVYSGADERKHQKLCVTGLCTGNSPGPVNSPHKGPVTLEMFPFDDVIMRQWKFHFSRGLFA